MYSVRLDYHLIRAVCRASEVISSTLCSMDDRSRLQVYSGLTLFTVFVNFARTIGLVYLCVNASQVLHDKMFKSVLQSPVLFFDSNPIGTIQNQLRLDFIIFVVVVVTVYGF